MALTARGMDQEGVRAEVVIDDTTRVWTNLGGAFLPVRSEIYNEY
jgi:hypothetical protein